MKRDFTELVFILDRSGSMSGLESDTIGGYNGMLEKQKNEPGEAIVTTVLFDDKYELLHDRINLKGVAPMTSKEYFVRGSTALLDAIGLTISKIGNAQQNTVESERAEHVLFVITTDGMENASREYGYDVIHKMISHQKEKCGWEFLFLGANIDAVATAGKLGIGKDHAVNYRPDSTGTEKLYNAVNMAACSLRKSGSFNPGWKADLEEDYNRRS
jgi:uncharacterized protein YegL